MGFWTKERPILEVKVEKTLKNTGTEGRPFFAKIGEILRFRMFGLLVYKHSTESNFPDTTEPVN